jgi:tRNA 2-selenouridine synthase
MSSPIWLEDESQRIGQINLPHTLWNTMRQSPVLFMAIPFEERLKHIVQEYGELDKEKMVFGIVRIQKRLGPMETKTAIQHLNEGDIESCFRILLRYYDKQYNKALNNREELKSLLTNLDCDTVNAIVNADKITAKELSIY